MLRNLVTGRPSPHGPGRRCFRPSLEYLEGRITPSVSPFANHPLYNSPQPLADFAAHGAAVSALTLPPTQRAAGQNATSPAAAPADSGAPLAIINFAPIPGPTGTKDYTITLKVTADDGTVFNDTFSIGAKAPPADVQQLVAQSLQSANWKVSVSTITPSVTIYGTLDTELNILKSPIKKISLQTKGLDDDQRPSVSTNSGVTQQKNGIKSPAITQNLGWEINVDPAPDGQGVVDEPTDFQLIVDGTEVDLIAQAGSTPGQVIQGLLSAMQQAGFSDAVIAPDGGIGFLSNAQGSPAVQVSFNLFSTYSGEPDSDTLQTDISIPSA